MLLLKRNLFFLITFGSLFTIFSLLFPQHWFIEVISPLICPDAVYFITTDKPIIALTIDDSPDRDTTEQILDVLAQHKVVATFFPISDNIPENQIIIDRIVNDGHEIGNHLTKDEPSIKLGANFEIELDKAHQILSDFTEIKWLRPGNGWGNKAMVETVRKYNYQIALGSVWSYDTHIPSSLFASWFILANTKPGSIIVLHDGGKRGERTVTTLKKIIPELKQKGYRFVTLSELNH
jgi:peptidoglycan/xylan/chitin deacetylase (PgdA/CDA1 family)